MVAVVVVVAVKEAVAPLGVSVPPVAGESIVQVSAVEQAGLAFRVALSVEVPPEGMVAGLALTVTPVTAQDGRTVTVAESNLVESATLVALMV
jgi:hypothetical protein